MSVLKHPFSKDRLPLYVANLTMNCATPLFYPANVPNDQIPAWAKKKSGIMELRTGTSRLLMYLHDIN